MRWTKYGDAPPESSAVYVVGGTDGGIDGGISGDTDGDMDVGSSEISSDGLGLLFRRYIINQASKARRITAAAAPTPIPAAAPGDSPDDGVLVVDGSGEEVGKDVVGEELVEGYS